MYRQFIYGKRSNGSGDVRIIARTAELQADENLYDIANKYRVWQNFSPRGSRRAVGSALREDGKELILIQAVRVQLEAAAFNQYRYVFIPASEMERINYRVDKLLAWLWNQKIPKVNNSVGVDLPLLKIPILENTSSTRASAQEIKQLKACLKEVDYESKPFLVSSLSILTKGGKVVVSREQGFRSPELYLASILLLIPAICRSQLSILVGDVDETSATWAGLILKTVSYKENGIKQASSEVSELTYLSRSKNRIIGDVKISASSSFTRKIEKILTNKEQWIPNLLNDLDGLRIANLKLGDLPNVINDFPETSYKIKIGVWGLSGSGKTTYITKLYDCLEKGKSDFRIVSESKDAREFVAFHLRNLARGSFSNPTDPMIDPKILKYEIQAEYSLFPFSMELSFVDAAGEWYQRIGELSQDGGEVLNTGDVQYEPEASDIDSPKLDSDEAKTVGVVDYLIGCDGIIFLLDPKADNRGERSHQFILPRVFRALRIHAAKNNKTDRRLDTRNKLTQFMAFCATKVDEKDYWHFTEDPDALVRDILGLATNALPTFCYFDFEEKENSERNRCNFFALSSIGRERDDNNEYSKEESVGIRRVDTEEEISTPLDRELEEKIEDSENEGWASSFAQQAKHESFESSPYEIFADNPDPYNVSAPLEWLISKIQEHKLPTTNTSGGNEK